MLKKELLLKKIEEVRDEMNKLIREDNKLLNPQVIKLSQKLDKLLNEYNNLLEKNN